MALSIAFAAIAVNDFPLCLGPWVPISPMAAWANPIGQSEGTTFQRALLEPAVCLSPCPHSSGGPCQWAHQA